MCGVRSDPEQWRTMWYSRGVSEGSHAQVVLANRKCKLELIIPGLLREVLFLLSVQMNDAKASGFELAG